MKQISQYLKDCNCFIRLEKDSKVWKVEKGAKHKDYFLNWEQANEELNRGYNIGLVGGYGYVIVDCDSIELSEAVRQLLPATYIESTINKGYHYIFECLESKDIKNQDVEWNKRHLGEIRALNQYVVIAPSKAKDEKKGILDVRDYTVIEHVSPARITKEDLNKILAPFSSEKTQDSNKKTSLKIDSQVLEQIKTDSELYNLYNGDVKKYASRSEAEESLVCKLVARGFDKQTIFSIMANSKIGKWKEKGLSYRDLTYEKGVAMVTQQKKDWKDGKNKSVSKRRFYNLYDIKSIKKNKNYIIENISYPQEITQNTGYTGHFKSILAMNKAICLASGKNYLGKKVKKRVVAYISAENSEIIDKERIIGICKGHKIRALNNFYYLPRQYCGDVMSEEFQEFLKKFIEEKKINYLIIDTISPVAEIDDNAGREVTKLFNKFFKPFVEDYNLNIDYLMHTDKNKRNFLGSIKWLANADNEFFFERPKNLEIKEVVISNTKNRNGEKMTMKIKINFDKVKNEITFNVLEEKGIGRKMQHTIKKKDIAKIGIKEVLKSGKLQYETILKYVVSQKKVSESTFKTALKELKINDEIIEDENGYSLKKQVKL